MVRKAKRECWQNFLEGIKELSNLAQISLEDKNRCWIALKYIKSKSYNAIPALIGLNNEIAITRQDKKVLVKLHVFPPLLIFYRIEYKPG